MLEIAFVDGLSGIDGNEYRIEIEHLDAPLGDKGIVMAGDTDEPCQALFFRLHEGVNRSARPEDLFDLLVRSYIVDLPEIQVIRLHVGQGLPEMIQSPLLVPCMGLAGEEKVVSSFS